MGDLLGIACLPLRWVTRKVWDLLHGFDSDAEYADIINDLRDDLLRRSEGT